MSQKLWNSSLARALVLKVLQSRRKKSFGKGRRVLNAELVPAVSQRVMKKGFLGSGRISPIARPIPRVRPGAGPVRSGAVRSGAGMVRPATTMDYLERPEGYGKLQPLLVDVTVTSIECPGADKTITIVRAGQVQGTRISLSQMEINGFLKKVSEKSHIPLVEGVFRAAVDNFVLNAVVSGVIGSRFVIKKQTPYSLLEGGGY
jgi:hypothetical protein